MKYEMAVLEVARMLSRNPKFGFGPIDEQDVFLLEALARDYVDALENQGVALITRRELDVLLAIREASLV